MARQLHIRSPQVRTLLAQSLCISHLLFGCIVWAPTLPFLPSLRYSAQDEPVAHTLQICYNSLLRWALDVPMTTRLELLHLLANLPPPATLLAKQLVCYAATIEDPRAPHRHATSVWTAIQTTETPLDSRAQVATTPTYWP